MTGSKTDILSLSLEELSKKITDLGEPPFRAKQIFQWLHSKKINNFDKMVNIPLSLRTKLDQEFCLNSLFILKKLESCADNTVKYLYRLSDGDLTESALMEYDHGYSLCISTQAGCRMGCAFCASGKSGLNRNLLPSEMLGQLYAAEEDGGITVGSIVLMGIGEPLDNYDNVIRFLKLLSDSEGRNMSLRRVSLSTCGIVPKIYELAGLKSGLTLSVSLHAADDEKRSEIMPVNKAYPIKELMKACDNYYNVTGRRISFEYAVIGGVNDSASDAEKLSRLLSGRNCHLNLIPVNSIRESGFMSDKKSFKAFFDALKSKGLNVTVRRTLGADINAACGQLRNAEEH